VKNISFYRYTKKHIGNELSLFQTYKKVNKELCSSSSKPEKRQLSETINYLYMYLNK